MSGGEMPLLVKHEVVAKDGADTVLGESGLHWLAMHVARELVREGIYKAVDVVTYCRKLERGSGQLGAWANIHTETIN